MDSRRHGKLPLSSQTSEEKEKDNDTLDEFNAYAPSWGNSDTDMSAMVSALTQVIGTTTNQNPHMPISTTIKQEHHPCPSSQPPLDQGNFIIYFLSYISNIR